MIQKVSCDTKEKNNKKYEIIQKIKNNKKFKK